MESVVNGLALEPGEFESEPQQKSGNIRDLRLSQDFENMVDVIKVVTTVNIGKPNPHVYFRAHPEWAGLYWMLELKQDQRSEFYIVDAKKVPEIAEEITPRLLVPLITRDGTLYIYPLRVETQDKKLDPAGKSARAAIEQAKTSWLRMRWNGREFKAVEAKALNQEPEWPDITFDRMLEIAFAGRIIDSLDHQAVKALNGEL